MVSTENVAIERLGSDIARVVIRGYLGEISAFYVQVPEQCGARQGKLMF
jgi:hypothetical protein